MPTELLKARGYKLQGVMKFQGLTISIENKKGSYREGVDSDGHKWKSYMYLDYGGVRGTEGKDGEYVDAYIGPDHSSDRVFVVHQNDPTTGRYDEDKAILGMRNAREAKAAYMRQYDRPGFFGSMDEYDMTEFKELLKKRKGLKLKKSKGKEIENMRITEETLDKALELSLGDLRKNLELGEEPGEKMSKMEILSKAQEAVRAGKLDLVTAGNIERRVNRGAPLEKAHRAALGLTGGAKIEGLKEPAASGAESRMGGKKAPGRPAAIKTGAPLPGNPIIEAMAAGQKLSHSYQVVDGTVMVVSGAEVLRKCQQLIREGKLTLMRAGDVERAVNTGLPIRPEVLRELFST